MAEPKFPGAEPHAGDVLDRLLAARADLLAAQPAARLFAFWDLDGTLLHGDCSEGLYEGGRAVYPGLVQCAIEAGHSDDYAAAAGFPVCWGDYRLLRDRFGDWMAYPFLAQIFAGAEEAALRDLARRHFETVLGGYFFAASLEIFRGLAAAGVEQHILSASPDFFVAGAAGPLGLPPERLHGIRLRTEEGVLTREVAAPVTWAAGKVARLRHILAEAAAAEPGRPAFVLAGFGNSLATDGDFLTHIAAQPLPSGRPVAVFVNPGRTVRLPAGVTAVRQAVLCGEGVG